MNKDVVVAIGAGLHQLALIRALVKKGWFTVAVDQNAAAPGFALADAAITHSAWDAEGVWQALRNTVDVSRIRAVLTQAARGSIETSALISRKLGLPHVAPETLRLLNSKAQAGRRFNTNTITTASAALRAQLDTLNFPLVIKTEQTSGGSGVFTAQNENEARQILNKLSEAEQVTAEPLVQGKHLGIIGLAGKGAIKFYGLLEQALHPDLSLRYTVFPAGLNADEEKRCLTYARQILSELSFTVGPFQLECILQPDGAIHFVELEASLLGSYISEYLIPTAGDNDLISDWIELAVNGTFDATVQPNRMVSVNRYFYPPKSGRLSGLECRHLPTGVQIRPCLAIGDFIPTAKQCAANALFSARSREQAVSTLEHLQLNVEVRDASA